MTEYEAEVEGNYKNLQQLIRALESQLDSIKYVVDNNLFQEESRSTDAWLDGSVVKLTSQIVTKLARQRLILEIPYMEGV